MNPWMAIGLVFAGSQIGRLFNKSKKAEASKPQDGNNQVKDKTGEDKSRELKNKPGSSSVGDISKQDASQQQELDAAQKELDAANEEVKTATAEAKGFDAKLEQATARLGEIDKVLQTSTDAVTTLNGDMGKITTELKELKNKKPRPDNYESEKCRLEGEQKRIQKEIETNNNTIKKLKEERPTVEQAKKDAQGKLDKVKAANGRLTTAQTNFKTVEDKIKKANNKDNSKPDETKAKKDEHIVVPGDTLWQIAKDNDMSLEKLLELNPEFKNRPGFILPGQKVKLKGEKTDAKDNSGSGAPKVENKKDPPPAKSKFDTEVDKLYGELGSGSMGSLAQKIRNSLNSNDEIQLDQADRKTLEGLLKVAKANNAGYITLNLDDAQRLGIGNTENLSPGKNTWLSLGYAEKLVKNIAEKNNSTKIIDLYSKVEDKDLSSLAGKINASKRSDADIVLTSSEIATVKQLIEIANTRGNKYILFTSEGADFAREIDVSKDSIWLSVDYAKKLIGLS